MRVMHRVAIFERRTSPSTAAAVRGRPTPVVVGLLLAQGATTIGIEPITSQAELLIAAVVFGIAQEPITNRLEARARTVQDAATDTGTSDTGTSE